MATFTVASVVSEGRLIDRENHHRKMLRRRDELDVFLRESGIGDAQRAATVLPITQTVDWDMWRAIVINTVASWRPPKGANPTDHADRGAFQKQVEGVLQQPDRLKGVTEAEVLVRPLYRDDDPILRKSVEEYRALLADGSLPHVGLQDDLTKAPAALR